MSFGNAVPVTSVTLNPTPITLIAGQQMNLTCTTSASNPQANITWYKSPMDITSQSTSMTQIDGGLLRTISTLLSRVVKQDNGKQVYCRASNIQGVTISSNMQSLNVMCKCTWLHMVYISCDYSTHLCDRGNWALVDNACSSFYFDILCSGYARFLRVCKLFYCQGGVEVDCSFRMREIRFDLSFWNR
mgnify:CR=1 FL=1